MDSESDVESPSSQQDLSSRSHSSESGSTEREGKMRIFVWVYPIRGTYDYHYVKHLTDLRKELPEGVSQSGNFYFETGAMVKSSKDLEHNDKLWYVEVHHFIFIIFS